MSQLDYAVSILNGLGESIGIGTIELDEDDRATVDFDRLPVTFGYQCKPFESLSLHFDLGEIPSYGDEGPEFLLQLALAAWAGESAMSIGLDDDGVRGIGLIVVPVAVLDAASLLNQLMTALEVALPIRDRLARQAYDIEAFELANDEDDGRTPTGAIRV